MRDKRSFSGKFSFRTILMIEYPIMTERVKRSFIKKISDRISGKEEDRNLLLELSPQVKNKLRQLVLRPNPTLAEFPFLGAGRSNVVDTLIYPGDHFSEHSGLLRSGFLGSQVDIKEIILIFNKLVKSGRTEDLKFFGHLHPSGECVIGGVTYRVKPSEFLLDPSGEYKKTAR